MLLEKDYTNAQDLLEDLKFIIIKVEKRNRRLIIQYVYMPQPLLVSYKKGSLRQRLSAEDYLKKHTEEIMPNESYKNKRSSNDRKIDIEIKSFFQNMKEGIFSEFVLKGMIKSMFLEEVEYLYTNYPKLRKYSVNSLYDERLAAGLNPWTGKPYNLARK